MSGGSEKTAGNQDLTIGQLEDRLELAMAMSKHLATQRGINQHTVRVAMESFGLELPVDVPLNSYTQHPSKTNYERTIQLLSEHQQSMLTKMYGSFKQAVRNNIDCIRNHTRVNEANTELMYRRLNQISAHVADFDWARAVEHASSDAAQHEVQRIEKIMATWLELGELGHEAVTTEDSLHAMAETLSMDVSAALEAKLEFAIAEDATALCERIATLRAKITTAMYSEPRVKWTPTELVHYVAVFGEQFKGAIPYRFQIETISFDSLLEVVDNLTEQDVHKKHLLSVSEAINNYLIDCWRLERVHIQAVQSAIKICESIHHLKVLTA